MPLAPKPINTRKIALVNELGYDGNLVIEGSFDGEGFDLWGVHDGGDLLFANDEPIRTHISWPTYEYRQRADYARLADFAESIGKTPEEWRAEEERIKRLVGP